MSDYAEFPEVPFLFSVRINLIDFGTFRKVSGLEHTRQPFELKEGGQNHSPRLLWEQGKYANLKLEWGKVRRPWLWLWHRWVDLAPGFRQDVQVIQRGREDDIIRYYYVMNAWPIGWTGTELSHDNSMSVESVTLAYDQLLLVTPDPF